MAADPWRAGPCEAGWRAQRRAAGLQRSLPLPSLSSEEEELEEAGEQERRWAVAVGLCSSQDEAVLTEEEVEMPEDGMSAWRV